MRPQSLFRALCMLSSLVAFALLASSQTAPQNFPDVSTEVDDVVVVAARPTWRLTVVVEGATEEATMVTSEPDIRCGAEQFKWGDLGRPRLCWARRERERSVVLTPTSPGRDWAVDWSGCTTIRPTGECDVELRGDTVITARFRRAG